MKDITNNLTIKISQSANDTNMSNYVQNVLVDITQQINNVDTSLLDYINDQIGYTQVAFQDTIDNLNADNIANGTKNQFIINDTYQGSLNVLGTLTTSNLQVSGTITHLMTEIYTTENLQIVSAAEDGPSLLISQSGNGSNNLFDAIYNDVNILAVKASGNVGIGNSNPNHKLEVTGPVKATTFIGSGALLNNVNIADRNTSMLVEGSSNLYYTPERVAIIVTASNITIHDHIQNTSNQVIHYIKDLDTNISNYISKSNSLSDTDTSNILNIINTKAIKTTADLVEGPSNLYYTPERVAIIINSSNNLFSNLITSAIAATSNELINVLKTTNIVGGPTNMTCNLDAIQQGITNKYIINNTYDADLSINGTLQTQNLTVHKRIDILNYTNANTVNINQIGTGNIFNISKGNSTFFVMRGDNGYFGNIANPEYNVDINGTIRSTYFRGSGTQLYNINLRDKTTTELREGNNLYYTDQRVNTVVTPLYSNMMSQVDQLKQELANINLDGIPQGSTNQFITNNLFNNSLLVNGTLTVRDLRIIDTDELYASNVYDPVTNGQSLISYNTSNLVYKFKNEFDNMITDIKTDLDIINASIDDVKETFFYVNLDHVVQGNNNKYIVNDIYNSSLLVNGTLTVKDIRILDVDDDYWSDVYASNLYNPNSSNIGSSTGGSTGTGDGGGTIKLLSEKNVSNIAINIIQANVNPEISEIRDDIHDLNDHINSINTNIDTVKEAMYYVDLDNVIQGSNNRYIVKNIYNNSLLVNGTLTVRDIRILDVDADEIDRMYNTDLYNPYGSNFDINSVTGNAGGGANSGGIKLLSEQNVSNITLGLLRDNMTAMEELADFLNIAQGTVNNAANDINALQDGVSGINLVLEEVNNDIIAIRNDISDVQELQRFINLDNIVQGANNQYIVNNIFNNSLLVNGTLTVKDIRILEVDDDLYSEIYTSNLYDPNAGIGNAHSYSVSTNMSNIAIDILRQKDYDSKLDTLVFNINSGTSLLSNRIDSTDISIINTSNNQAVEISMLKNNISLLTSNLNNVLERLSALEARLG
jgi:hypothetical protein